MIARGIHHIGMNSANASALVEFYTQILDFRLVTDFVGWRDYREADALVGTEGSAAAFAMLQCSNCYLEIFQYENPASENLGAKRAWDRGYTHLCLGVDDVVAAHHELKTRGMPFLAESPVDFGEIKAIYGRDPDGNLIELIQTTGDHPFAFSGLKVETPCGAGG